MMDFVIRDLFAYLVKKYDIENISSAEQRVSSETWTALCKEFHDILENVVTIQQDKLSHEFKRWKDHPEILQPDAIPKNFEVILEKVRKLKERAQTDPKFAAFLTRESDQIGKDDNISTPPNFMVRKQHNSLEKC